ncbi:MAG TPA: VOC family protein, partial [Candidatus Obscuribacterales bacterium]
YGESPMAEQTPAEWHDKIIHAHLIVGGTNLMAADAPPDYFEPAKGTSVLIELPTLEEAERIFAAFAEGGTVTMPLQATFWSPGFGMVTDQFGTPWMLNCD